MGTSKLRLSVRLLQSPRFNRCRAYNLGSPYNRMRHETAAILATRARVSARRGLEHETELSLLVVVVVWCAEDAVRSHGDTRVDEPTNGVHNVIERRTGTVTRPTGGCGVRCALFSRLGLWRSAYKASSLSVLLSAGIGV